MWRVDGHWPESGLTSCHAGGESFQPCMYVEEIFTVGRDVMFLVHLSRTLSQGEHCDYNHYNSSIVEYRVDLLYVSASAQKALYVCM